MHAAPDYDVRDRAAVVAAFGDEMAKGIIQYLNQQMPPPLRNCINCLNFDETNELCKLYKMRPPARVIATACPAHTDLIPF